MAQNNFTPILTYGSTTASSVPSAANLTTDANGVELAVNAVDGKLFYKDNAGVVQVLATRAAAQNTFSAGTTGLTPNVATSGAVVLSGTLAVANGGTGVTASTGTGSNVLNTSPTLVTPALGTPSSGIVTNLTGTASININGTVGATTTAAGSFTTLRARIDGAGQLVQGRFNNETGGIDAESSIHLGYSTSNFYGYRIANTNNPTSTAAGTLRIQRGTTAAWVDALTIDNSGSIAVVGSLSKGSGSFRVDHPLPALTATRQLVHSFIEGPKADLIYRGNVALVDGQATVNIDTAATMTEGTFEVLCRDVQCFTTNESDWICVRGKVTGNILTIEAEDITATSVVSWMVIGERQDPHMMETEWTDENGRVIVEPLKPVLPAEVETPAEEVPTPAVE